MDIPPLRPRHHPPVAGEIKRTDADAGEDARRRRMRTAGFADELAGLRPAGAVARRDGGRLDGARSC